MFKRLADFVAFALTISQRTEAHARRIEALETDVTRLSRTLDALLAEFRYSRQHEQDEREKQSLRFQLALERLERRPSLPPSPPPAGSELA